MTSKEALEIIKKYDDDVMIRILCHNVFPPETLGSPSKEEFEEAVKVIKEDLDLLESLKHLIEDLEITFNTELFSKGGYIGTIIKDYFINNDVTGKLEEWLKHENNNK